MTLEPCNHTGRTGPCTEALIAAGLKRVVAATIDPNPAVAGHGMDRLACSGHRNHVGVCQAEARRLNEGFARWSQHKRPLVLMKVAMTLDGRIAPPAGQHTAREPYWITCEAARAAVQPLRWQADAALTGVDTVLADDPMLTDRSGLRRRRPLLARGARLGAAHAPRFEDGAHGQPRPGRFHRLKRRSQAARAYPARRARRSAARRSRPRAAGQGARQCSAKKAFSRC